MRTVHQAFVTILLTSLWASLSMAQAVTYPLSYSGRITDVAGKPLEGTVHLTVSFYRSATGTDLVAVTPVVPATTEFRQGVFQLPITLSAADVNTLFDGALPVWIEVKNVDTGVAFSRQTFSMVPYALRVPIDNDTIVFNAEGKLTVGTLPKQAEATHADSADLATLATSATSAVTSDKIDSINVSAAGAADGDFLKWNTVEQRWKPGGITGQDGGTVTDVIAGAGLTGGPINTSGTLSIATGGVTDGMLAGSISDGKITSSGNWNTAFAERDQWNGGPTGLVPATGRTSLQLGDLATLNTVDSATITDLSIMNGDINAAAGITDGKLATISTAGKVSGAAINSGTISGTAGFDATGGVISTAAASASVPLTAKGAASQTGNLVEFKNSSNAVLTAINAAGNFTGNAATATTATTATSATTAGTATNFSGSLSGDVTGTQGATVIGSGAVNSGKILDDSIMNVDINASAAIADSKLATISTAGKVSGSAITSGTIAGSTIVNTSGNLLTSGSVGIGTTSPAASLHVRAPAVAGTAEDIAKFAVTDDTTGYFKISNATLGDGAFLPSIYTQSAGTAIGGVWYSQITTDTGTNPVTVFDSLIGPAWAAVTTRPLFDFRTNGTSKMLIGASGNVGIGTTSPTQALQIGTLDTTGVNAQKAILVSGNGAGNQEGGELILEMAADYDGTYNSYNIDTFEDDFRINRGGSGVDFTLASNGYVGIGTSIPTAKLHVAGTPGVDGIKFPDGTTQTTSATGLTIRDLARKLVVTNGGTPATQVTVTADEIMLEDSSYNPKRVTAVSVTATISTAGANGLDTGSEAASIWYHIWVINNGTTTSALLSVSATAPTMPSGYTYKAYVGAVYNNASSNFLSFHQRGKRAVLDAYVQVLAAGTVTASFTAVTMTAAVPTTAQLVFGDTGINSSWDSFQQAGVHLAATSGGADTKRYVEYSEPTYTADQPFEFSMSMRTAQTIYYKCYEKNGGCQSGGVFVRVNGWEYE